MEMASGQLAGQALCMEQYYKLLRSHRLPGKDCDRLVTMTTEPRNENSYIIVAYKNEVIIKMFALLKKSLVIVMNI